MTNSRGIWLIGAALVLSSLTGCSPSDEGASADEAAAGSDPAAAGEPTLGPVDGHDLPGVDLDRIQVGDTAPDFSLESYGGEIVTLSDYRGQQDVILVFYRGHW